MYIWSDTNPYNTIQSRQPQNFSINFRADIFEGCFLGPYVLPPRPIGGACHQFSEHISPEILAMSRWIFDETCGPCMTVPEPISVTSPEISFRLPALGVGWEGRDQYLGEVVHQT
jgi:hypothetical protein